MKQIKWNAGLQQCEVLDQQQHPVPACFRNFANTFRSQVNWSFSSYDWEQPTYFLSRIYISLIKTWHNKKGKIDRNEHIKVVYTTNRHHVSINRICNPATRGHRCEKVGSIIYLMF